MPYSFVFTAPPKLDYEYRLKELIAARAGGSFIITVNVSGIPPPDTVWYHNGECIILCLIRGLRHRNFWYRPYADSTNIHF